MDLEFNISHNGGQLIEIFHEIPKAFEYLRLPASTGTYAKANFADMLFFYFKGDGFEIWMSHYIIKETATVIAKGNFSVLEWRIPFKNHFASKWYGFGETDLLEKQYEVSYSPFIHNEAFLIGGTHYQTIDFHFSKEMLQEYAPDYPLLKEFLEKVERNEPANLLGTPLFLSPEMISIINRVLNYDMGDAMAGMFYDGAVNQLLVYLLDRISGYDLQPPKVFSNYDVEKTIEAKDICMLNFAQKHTLRQLSKKVGLNLSKLQECFKSLHGVTFYNYILAAKMEMAKELLLRTDYTIQDIAERVGYTEGTNLTTPFKKYFGYTPEYLKENKK